MLYVFDTDHFAYVSQIDRFVKILKRAYLENEYILSHKLQKYVLKVT